MNGRPIEANRLRIASADDHGLGLDDGDNQWVVPWTIISQISAALVPHGSAFILIAAIGIGDERIVMVAEDQPVWHALMESLERNLPGVQPFKSWGPQVRSGDRVHVIYP